MKTGCGNKLDEKLSEALSQVVFSETESFFADRDALQNWLDEGAQRQNITRHRKIRRAGLAAAAVFLCVVLLTGSLLLSDALPPSLKALLSPEEGVAVPGFNSNVESGNGNVVIGGDGNGNTGTWTATFTSYDEIPEKYREQIIWFEDMPEGYELETVTLVDNLNTFNFASNFKCDENYLLLKQTKQTNDGSRTAILNKYFEPIRIAEKTVYRGMIDGTWNYIYFEDMWNINLIAKSDLSTKKIEAMLASVKIGWST